MTAFERELLFYSEELADSKPDDMELVWSVGFSCCIVRQAKALRQVFAPPRGALLRFCHRFVA